MLKCLSKSESVALGKNLTEVEVEVYRGLPLRGLVIMLKYLHKSESLTLGKNLTYVEVFLLGFHQDVE